jgi:hypothetical protein
MLPQMTGAAGNGTTDHWAICSTGLLVYNFHFTKNTMHTSLDEVFSKFHIYHVDAIRFITIHRI